jgi:hypothetical protein
MIQQIRILTHLFCALNHFFAPSIPDLILSFNLFPALFAASDTLSFNLPKNPFFSSLGSSVGAWVSPEITLAASAPPIATAESFAAVLMASFENDSSLTDTTTFLILSTSK